MNVLKNLLTAPFKEDNYIKFSKEFLKNLDSIPLRESFDIPSMFRDSIQSYTVYGKYIDQNGENILVLSVKVNANSKAIKAQRNFIAYLLENKYIDFTAALVAYFNEVKVDKEIEENNSKTESEITSTKPNNENKEDDIMNGITLNYHASIRIEKEQ